MKTYNDARIGTWSVCDSVGASRWRVGLQGNFCGNVFDDLRFS
jgi:hypothetical protein